MSKNIDKIKKLIKAKDKRFWLMIFVVVSTLSILLIWILDIKNVFQVEKKVSKNNFDFTQMKNDAQSDIDKTLNDLSALIEKQMKDEDLERAKNSSGIMDLKKVEELIEEKNNQIEGDKNNNQTKNKDIEKNSLENNSEEIDPVQVDLEKSDQVVEDLKKRIEELEKNLENN